MRRHVTITTQKSTTFIVGPSHFLVLVQISIAAFLLSVATVFAGPQILSATDAENMAKNDEIILIDIRTPQEWATTGVGEGAVALDMTAKSFLGALKAIRKSHPSTQIAFICATGGRSGHVVRYLTAHGFDNTADVAEGMMGSQAGPGWLKRGLPTYAANPGSIRKRLQALADN